MISVCIDSNVYISAIAFGGKPLTLVQKALRREFSLVTGMNILEDVEHNLLFKLELDPKKVDRFINDIMEISSIYTPAGQIKYTSHASDNLVIEVAIMGGTDYLVTGDKKHLLPLKKIESLIIESPDQFLKRFGKG